MTAKGDGSEYGAVAVLIHWGDPKPTLDLVAIYLTQGHFDRVVVVANDRRPKPSIEVDVEWIVPERNLGYGAACQRAVSLVYGDYYAFLNNDVLLDDAAAARCLAALEAGELAIAGPVLTHEDGRLQSGCGEWSRILRIPRIRNPVTSRITRCAWITGAAMFCRRDVVIDVGFDGSYFLGGEDADLCFRARERGLVVGIVRDARGTHEGKTTISGGRWQYYHLRNRVWLARRRHPLAVALANYVWVAGVLAPRVLCADILKRRGYNLSRSAFRAVVDAGRRLPPFGDPWPHEPVPQAWMAW